MLPNTRNHFTPSCVFGYAWKIWSNGKSFSLTVKCGLLKCKIDYRSILPSNHFQEKKKKKTEPRERERGRSPKLEINGTAIWAMPLIFDQAKINSTPPSSLIHKHPRPTSLIVSQAPTSTSWASILTTNCRPCSTRLSNALADLAATTDCWFGYHWPPTHSTPPPNPPNLAAAASIHSDPFFPSISHSFFFLSQSLWIKDVFILIFGCVKCIFWNFWL